MGPGKQLKVNGFITKLKQLAAKYYNCGKIDKSLAAISSCSDLLYEWNQSYKDDDLEKQLKLISESLIKPSFGKVDTHKNTIMFYDSFAADLRGLAIIYLKALGELGYHVILVTVRSKQNKQPILENAIKAYHVTWVFVDDRSYTKKLFDIDDAICKYKPSSLFMQLTPGDAAAIAVFNEYKGIIDRYQINLTDHAFWLGLNAFDYSIEFRNFGASVSYQFRGVPKNRIIWQPYYPYCDRSVPFDGLDERFANKKIIFSGGALYKTLGDHQSTYYKIVESLLEGCSDAVFVFATNNEPQEEMLKLLQNFPERSCVIKERKDLYEVIKHSCVYLNTYPFYGGLMTQYAIVAGRIPLTLVQNRDLDGILIKQGVIPFEFSRVNDLVEYGLKVLNDDSFRKEQENNLGQYLIDEQKFNKSVQQIILKQTTDYLVDTDQKIELQAFREQYFSRFNFNRVVMHCLGRPLVFDFPLLAVRKILFRLGLKLKAIKKFYLV